MGERFRDFDAFEAEQSDDPVSFRLAGRDWPAVNANDAATFLRFVKQASRVETSFDAIAQYLEDMLAPEDRVPFVEALREHRIKMTTIREVVTWVFLQVSGLPLAEAPSSARGRSKTGARSKVRSRSKASKPDSSLSAVS